MGLYEPKSCCFCFDTKTGSLIWASLSLVGSILMVGSILITLSTVSGHLGSSLDAASEPLVQSHDLDTHDKRNIILYVCISVLVICAAFLGLCSILLIHGIRKNRPGLMLPYLILQRFCIAMDVILIVTRASFFDHHHVYIHFVGGLIVVTIEIYFNLVINAYHNKVKDALSKDYLKFNNEGTDSIGQSVKAV